MPGYSSDDMSVTTWGDGLGAEDEHGQPRPWRWIARHGKRWAHFWAQRDADMLELFRLGRAALDNPDPASGTDGHEAVMWAVMNDCFDGANHNVIVAICQTKAAAEHIAAQLSIGLEPIEDGFRAQQIKVQTGERFDDEHGDWQNDRTRLTQDRAQQLLLGGAPNDHP